MRVSVALFLCCVLASLAAAQKVSKQHLTSQQPSTSDPQALNLVAQSIAAMTGGNPVVDVSLTSSATWFAGSDTGTGKATLLGKGTNESLVSVKLGSGQRIEIRNSSTGLPRGKWINKDGTSRLFAAHNCWTA